MLHPQPGASNAVHGGDSVVHPEAGLPDLTDAAGLWTLRAKEEDAADQGVPAPS